MVYSDFFFAGRKQFFCFVKQFTLTWISLPGPPNQPGNPLIGLSSIAAIPLAQQSAHHVAGFSDGGHQGCVVCAANIAVVANTRLIAKGFDGQTRCFSR